MAIKKKVFSIEGNWDRGLSKQRSIEPALDYFAKNSSVEVNKSRATHPDELYRHLKEVSYSRNKNFKIVYLSCHGNRGCIWLGHRQDSYMTIEDIADNCEGFLEGKLIHFGSCSTLFISEKRIQDFLFKTKALAIAGYTKQIDFHESTFLDILLFDRYQRTDNIKTVERQFKNDYVGLIDRLGFKLFLQA